LTYAHNGLTTYRSFHWFTSLVVNLVWDLGGLLRRFESRVENYREAVMMLRQIESNLRFRGETREGLLRRGIEYLWASAGGSTTIISVCHD
jgi:hypothetical protein